MRSTHRQRTTEIGKQTTWVMRQVFPTFIRMNKTFRADRWLFYGKIAVAYLALWTLADLVSETATFYPRVLNNLWRTLFVLCINYWLFEKIRKRLSLQRWFKSGLTVAAFVLITALAAASWRKLGIWLGIHTSFKTYSSFAEAYGDHLSNILFSIVFFGGLKHIYDYRNLKITAQQLKIEKQEAELNYLKSQTNPHFLFNTLNNIYALSKEKSDLAPESILRLSKILRFMLYESATSFVTIEQELAIISDYIALERLRYDERLRVNFNHSIQHMQQSITPLLLIPLVENAFKHGVSETRDNPFIDIHLSVANHKLVFHVKNSVGYSTAEPIAINENIGLKNLRRQLQLLYREYALDLERSGTAFSVKLTINLLSHV